jgi:hypothetical protein
MNYAKLSKAQKRCIDAFVKIRPELASAESISRTDVEELFEILHAEREHGGEKIGYPMWLVKGEKVGRGMYKFPAPSLAETVETSTSEIKENTSAAITNAQEDKEFFQDLQKYGIMEQV